VANKTNFPESDYAKQNSYWLNAALNNGPRQGTTKFKLRDVLMSNVDLTETKVKRLQTQGGEAKRASILNLSIDHKFDSRMVYVPPPSTTDYIER